jgi:hypothetical protein
MPRHFDNGTHGLIDYVSLRFCTCARLAISLTGLTAAIRESKLSMKEAETQVRLVSSPLYPPLLGLYTRRLSDLYPPSIGIVPAVVGIVPSSVANVPAVVGIVPAVCWDCTRRLLGLYPPFIRFCLPAQVCLFGSSGAAICKAAC